MLDFDFINYGLSGNAKAEKEVAEYLSKIDASVFILDYDHNAPDVDYLRKTHYQVNFHQIRISQVSVQSIDDLSL